VEVKSLIGFLPLGTGSISGTYYPLGLAFANVMSSKLKDIDVMALSTTGSKENIRLLKKKELKLAITQSDVFYNAVNGLGEFKDENFKELRAMLSLYPEVVQVITRADSSINSLMDLKGKRIILGSKGSGNSVTAITILRTLGIHEGEFEPAYLSYDEAIGGMEEKKYDAFFLVAGLPTKVVRELKSRIRVKILSFTDDEIKLVCGKLKYMSPIIIKAKTYLDQPIMVKTVALKALLITTTELSSKIVYRLLGVIFNNLSYLKKMHPRAGDISVKTYMEAIPKKFIHEGSLKFYNKLNSKKR
jgi:TRAP transporter TAXI family solute receptor